MVGTDGTLHDRNGPDARDAARAFGPRTKDRHSRTAGLAKVFKLMISRQKRLRRLEGSNGLPETVQGIELHDEIRQLHVAS